MNLFEFGSWKRRGRSILAQGVMAGFGAEWRKGGAKPREDG
jgi:hypothetical protein